MKSFLDERRTPETKSKACQAISFDILTTEQIMSSRFLRRIEIESGIFLI